MGSENLPAIPLNSTLEATMLPNAEKLSKKNKRGFSVLNSYLSFIFIIKN